MPRKKEEIIEVVDFRLTEMEMKNLDLYEAQANLQMQIKDRLALEERLLSIEFQTKRGEIRQKQLGAVSSMEEAKSRYNLVVQAIQTRLKINLSEYAVKDDGSLVLMQNSNPNKEVLE